MPVAGAVLTSWVSTSDTRDTVGLAPHKESDCGLGTVLTKSLPYHIQHAKLNIIAKNSN